MKLDPFWAHDQPPERVCALLAFERAREMLIEDNKERKAIQAELDMIRKLGGEVFNVDAS